MQHAQFMLDDASDVRCTLQILVLLVAVNQSPVNQIVATNQAKGHVSASKLESSSRLTLKVETYTKKNYTNSWACSEIRAALVFGQNFDI